ncbi:MAG: helix-turn-helix domain-containing protein [Candidatus Aenigmatarchaeota archaeon]
MGYGSFVKSKEAVLDNPKRRKMYDIILKSGGKTADEIKKETGLTMESVDYHLHYLQMTGFIHTTERNPYTYRPVRDP